MLTEKRFNEIKNCTYIEYLCKIVTELHTKASGSCFDSTTNELELIYQYLAKQINAECINDVSEFVQKTTGVEVFDGWVSPVFAMLFNVDVED